MSDSRLLIVRLGALGDIIHTLPAAAALKRKAPGRRLSWLVENKWLPLLEGNPHLDEVVTLDRSSGVSTIASGLSLRRLDFPGAIDFQGLIKSAICSRLAANSVRGFAMAQLRERHAAWLYHETIHSSAAHVIDQNLELAGCSGAPHEFWIPPGKPEGSLPDRDFVLASPLAGWGGKQWPSDRYAELRTLLADRGLALVLNGPPGSGLDHESGLAGLIDATRRAAAVAGVDSGPMHLAAALAKPGVAIFGPTDPARNGPAGSTLRVLRAPAASTTYKRQPSSDVSMISITARQVADALMEAMER
jgi:heptosyltransferase-1